MSEVRGFGRFEGRTHVLQIRVYYEDTDLSGIVYHANYLRFMERGRSEFFRCAGIAKLAASPHEDGGWAWTLRKAAIEYLKPARVDDLLDVHTSALELTGARMIADQKIYCAGQLLTRGSIEACIISLAGKPRRIPTEMRDKLQPLLCETNA